MTTPVGIGQLPGYMRRPKGRPMIIHPLRKRIPKEVQAYWFQFLDIKDLAAASASCKAWLLAVDYTYTTEFACKTGTTAPRLMPRIDKLNLLRRIRQPLAKESLGYLLTMAAGRVEFLPYLHHLLILRDRARLQLGLPGGLYAPSLTLAASSLNDNYQALFSYRKGYTFDEEWGHTTPLCRAAEAGNADAIHLLLLFGEDPNIRNKAKDRPLSLAIRQGNVRSIEALLGRVPLRPPCHPHILAEQLGLLRDSNPEAGTHKEWRNAVRCTHAQNLESDANLPMSSTSNSVHTNLSKETQSNIQDGGEHFSEPHSKPSSTKVTRAQRIRAAYGDDRRREWCRDYKCGVYWSTYDTSIALAEGEQADSAENGSLIRYGFGKSIFSRTAQIRGGLVDEEEDEDMAEPVIPETSDWGIIGQGSGTENRSSDENELSSDLERLHQEILEDAQQTARAQSRNAQRNSDEHGFSALEETGLDQLEDSFDATLMVETHDKNVTALRSRTIHPRLQPDTDYGQVAAAAIGAKIKLNTVDAGKATPLWRAVEHGRVEAGLLLLSHHDPNNLVTADVPREFPPKDPLVLQRWMNSAISHTNSARGTGPALPGSQIGLPGEPGRPGCAIVLPKEFEAFISDRRDRCDPEAAPDGEYTSLSLAAKRGDVRFVQLLLHYGANVNQQGRKEQTPLLTAILSNQEHIIRLLLSMNLEHEKAEKVEEVIEDIRSKRRRKFLGVSSSDDNDDEHGGNDENETPLAEVCSDADGGGLGQCVNALGGWYDSSIQLVIPAGILKAGYFGSLSLPETVSSEGIWPILLREKGIGGIFSTWHVEPEVPVHNTCTLSIADAEAQAYGKSPCVHEQRVQMLEIYMQLVERWRVRRYYLSQALDELLVRSKVCSSRGIVPGRPPIEVDLPDESGFTPLYIAAEKGKIDTVKLLMASGADHTHCTKRGKPVIYAAVERGHIGVINSLLPYCTVGQLRQKTKFGTDVLFMANKSGKKHVKTLLNEWAEEQDAIEAQRLEERIQSKRWGKRKDRAKVQHDIMSRLMSGFHKDEEEPVALKSTEHQKRNRDRHHQKRSRSQAVTRKSRQRNRARSERPTRPPSVTSETTDHQVISKPSQIRSYTAGSHDAVDTATKSPSAVATTSNEKPLPTASSTESTGPTVFQRLAALARAKSERNANELRSNSGSTKISSLSKKDRKRSHKRHDRKSRRDKLTSSPSTSRQKWDSNKDECSTDYDPIVASNVEPGQAFALASRDNVSSTLKEESSSPLKGGAAAGVRRAARKEIAGNIIEASTKANLVKEIERSPIASPTKRESRELNDEQNRNIRDQRVAYFSRHLSGASSAGSDHTNTCDHVSSTFNRSQASTRGSSSIEEIPSTANASLSSGPASSAANQVSGIRPLSSSFLHDMRQSSPSSSNKVTTNSNIMRRAGSDKVMNSARMRCGSPISLPSSPAHENQSISYSQNDDTTSLSKGSVAPIRGQASERAKRLLEKAAQQKDAHVQRMEARRNVGQRMGPPLVPRIMFSEDSMERPANKEEIRGCEVSHEPLDLDIGGIGLQAVTSPVLSEKTKWRNRSSKTNRNASHDSCEYATSGIDITTGRPKAGVPIFPTVGKSSLQLAAMAYGVAPKGFSKRKKSSKRGF